MIDCDQLYKLQFFLKIVIPPNFVAGTSYNSIVIANANN